jgi:hypothetical protein
MTGAMTKSREDRGWLFAALALCIALALMSILANGYVFGVGDQTESLPQVKRVLDSSYLQNDWVVNVNSATTVRLGYSVVMAFLSSVLGFEAAFFAVYVVALAALCLAVFIFAVHLWGEPGIGLIAVMLILYNRLGSLGGSQLIFLELIPATLAYSTLTLAAYWLYRGHHGRSTALVVLAGALHLQVALNAGLVFGFATLVAKPLGSFRQWLRVSWPLIVAVMGLAVVGVIAQGRGSKIVDPAEAVRILAWARAPWHFVPFTWGWTVWANFAAFGVLVVVARWSAPRVRFLDGLILGVLGLCLLSTMALLWKPLLPLVYLQPFRMTVFVQWAGALYLAHYIWTLLCKPSAPDRLVGLILLAGLVLVPKLAGLSFNQVSEMALRLAITVSLWHVFRTFVQSDALPANLARYRPALYWLLATLFVWLVLDGVRQLFQIDWGSAFVYPRMIALSLGLIALQVLATHSIHSTLWRRVALVATGVMSVGILSLVSVNWTSARLPIGLAHLTANVQTHFSPKNSFDRLGSWARENTPPDAVFIVPPYTDSFRLVAERAIVVDFKTFGDALEWRQRMDDLSGGRSLALGEAYYTQLREAYTQLSPEQFASLGQKYNAQYVVVERSQAPLGDFTVVYENDGYFLYQLGSFPP